MAKQTAVQWFCNKLSDLDTRPRETLQILEWYEQAKQIEKEQIEQAYAYGSNDRLHNFINEYYYKEIYENNK